MRKLKTHEMKRILLSVVLVVAVLALAALGVPTINVERAHADFVGNITVTAEVSGLVEGQENPEFTVTLKVENNTMTLGGLEIILTPLDDNVTVGDADANYVAGDTWSAANGFARVDNGKNIHMIGSDDVGVTKASFIHGGFKFKYDGTPSSGGIPFNVAYEAAADDCGDDIEVKYNGQTLTGDLDATNFTATPRVLDTTNTLSALTLTAGGTTVISGTDEEQTASTEIANADKAKVKISATRAGAASKIKVTEGDKTIVAEQTKDVSDASLGDLSVGEHTVTVTVTSESGAEKTYTLKFTVADAQATPVTKPTASTTSGGYSGLPIDFTPSGMKELVSAGKVKLYSVSETGAETVAGIEAFNPTNAGQYKIIARPADGYCWDGGDTSDAEYTFKIDKAKLTAVPSTTGGLFTVTSDTYTGATDSVYEYKYYSDSACTQEVSKDALAEGTKYYVKPVLKAGMGGNFEFDAGAITQGIVNSGAEYTTPETSKPTPTPTPTPSDEKEKKGIPWWVWLIVAAVVLALILLFILLFMKRRKNDDDGKRANAPYPTAFMMPNGTKGNDGKTEKLEDRIHELEKEANEREVTRYKEEAERAERKANRKDSVSVPPVVPFPTPATTTDTAAQERVRELEARMHEMEKEAYEKEVQRYKEEAERAEKKAEKNEKVNVPPVVPFPTPATTVDTAAQERVRELEARMHEMEKEAYEKEVQRYKEEAERAEQRAARNAEKRVIRFTAPSQMKAPVQAAPVAPVAPVAPMMATVADTAAQERVRELEARMREMEKEAHEVERQAHDRELSRYKEEMEHARREAERARDPYYGGRTGGYQGNGGDSERVKELEARMREMEREAHEKELQRYKEEAEAAKRAAEERYYAKHPMPEPSYVPYRANEEQASPYVMKLEEQLRRMEQEAHERELARYRSEAERARKEAEELARRSRRQEEELNRLHDLQTMEQRSREIVTAQDNAAGRGAGNEVLQRMEEQMRRQNSELQFLTEELERKLAAAMRK